MNELSGPVLKPGRLVPKMTAFRQTNAEFPAKKAYIRAASLPVRNGRCARSPKEVALPQLNVIRRLWVL
ncbi:hypothetical protein [Martelella mangrovi]|uniref:Uncharacterized protein n=1 Tax=Martelella mangrovi TaxID=1397477 RepID=A0ABV2I748_9HYPH|nr:hypothetical protein [uncultured Martelella sp.]